MGLHDVQKHPPLDPADARKIIAWFQSEAPPPYRLTYVGGTPARWRTLTADAAPNPSWHNVYRMMDVVQPWMVGRYRNTQQIDDWRKNVLEPDLAELKKNGQIYSNCLPPPGA